MSINSLTNLINQTVPYAWDNSLSMMEFLGKIVTSMNQVIALVNEKLPEDFEQKFYNMFLTYTDAKMNEIIASGEFAEILDSMIVNFTPIKNEVIDARQGALSLGANITDVKSQLAAITNYIEIEPDTLRVSEEETDSDLLQKAITLCDGAARRTHSIKLGRIYTVDETIMLPTSISYVNNPHLIIKGYGGGLQLGANVYMFDGVKNSGGLHFQNVKFIGNTFTHDLINCDHLIEIGFYGCQFVQTYTIISADEINGYIQSGRFIDCNFKGMKDYQIKSAMVYDMVINNNHVEWGIGGLIKLTQPSSSQYCSVGLTIANNLIQGIAGQIPIKLMHNARCTIEKNYFEGNNYTDIDMSGGVIPHRGITITNNSFGNYVASGNKSSCIKVGLLYTNQGYDFSGNSGSMLIFDFTGSGGKWINMTGGIKLNNGQPNYIGINPDYLFYGNMTKKSAKTVLTPILKTFEYAFSKLGSELINGTIYTKLNFKRGGSALYFSQYAGYLYFISGYNAGTSSVQIEVKFKPTLILTANSFAEAPDLTELKVVFKSTGTNRIAFTSIETIITDTVVFEALNGTTSDARDGYAVDIDSLIMN